MQKDGEIAMETFSLLTALIYMTLIDTSLSHLRLKPKHHSYKRSPRLQGHNLPGSASVTGGEKLCVIS